MKSKVLSKGAETHKRAFNTRGVVELMCSTTCTALTEHDVTLEGLVRRGERAARRARPYLREARLRRVGVQVDS